MRALNNIYGLKGITFHIASRVRLPVPSHEVYEFDL